MDSQVSNPECRPLQDIAGNVLDVKITTSTYDPEADYLVSKIAYRKRKREECIEEDEGHTLIFKMDVDVGNQAHAVPMVASINSLNPALFQPPKLERSATTYDV